MFVCLFVYFTSALFNAAGHASTVAAMFEKGGASFTHVIKASEPVVSVILGLIINRVVPKPLTALSLIPISYGVAYASTLGNLNAATMGKELATKSAILAMASNVFFCLRSILRKKLPKDFQVFDEYQDKFVSRILIAWYPLRYYRKEQS